MEITIEGASEHVSVAGRRLPFVEDETVAAVLKALKGNVVARVLTVEWWKAGPEGVEQLRSLLEVTVALWDVNLSWRAGGDWGPGGELSEAGLSTAVVSAVCEGLRKNTRAFTVNIKYNQLPIAAVRTLVDFLRDNKTVWRLFVAFHSSAQEEAEKLFVEMLEDNHTLQDVDIYIGDAERRARFKELLARNVEEAKKETRPTKRLRMAAPNH